MAKQDTNKNFKPSRGLGGAVTRQRRRIVDGVRADKDAFVASNKRAAVDELARNKYEFERRAEVLRDRFIRNLLSSTVNVSTAVTRSRGLTPNVKANVVTGYGGFEAYTDFSQIVIKWPADMLPKDDTNMYEVLDTIAQIRGVYFHEEGHIRYTVPFQQLRTVVKDAWCDDNPGEIPPTQEISDYALVRTWNALEDQRMECAVVADVPRMATYFTPMAINILLQQGTNGRALAGRKGDLRRAYVLVAGRSYIAANIRQECADIFNALCEEHAVLNGAATWFDIVSRYKAAVTHAELNDIVIEAHKFLGTINDPDGEGGSGSDEPSNGQTHRQQYRNSNADPEAGATDTDPADAPDKADPADKPEDAKPESGKGDSKDESKEEAKGDATAPHKDEYGDDSNKPTEDRTGEEREAPTSSPEGNQSNHGDGSHVFNKDALTSALEEAIEAANSSLRQDKDVLDIFSDLGDYDSGSGLPEYDGKTDPMTDAELEGANNIATGIQNALETYVSAASPQWKTHQERGVIQPLQYRTKEIGSQEYHRRLDGNGNDGLDLHVSILADVSGSMYGYMTELSQFMYAARSACESLGIGVTQSVWSSGHQQYRIWSSGAKPEIFPSMGGTEPTGALDDLNNHNPEGAANHLVLIFTDGEWGNGFPSLARWSAPGRSIMFIRYGYGGSAESMGADSHIQINQINQLGEQLTYGISDVLAFANN